jgi:hypothetical protein
MAEHIAITNKNNSRKEALFPMPRKKREHVINPTVQAADTTSRRALIGGIIIAVITVAGGIMVAIINGWFSSVKSNSIPDTGIYRVRVTVLDDQKKPTDEANVWSNFGGEAKKVAAGWQFDIPAASKPKDGKLTIFASKESAFLNGEESLSLDKELNPAITIKLHRDTTAKVRGQVIDSKNRGIAGARVFVVGYEAEAVITKEGGNFELPAHAAVNQPVLLHAEKSGYPAELWHPAGETPAKLVLVR